MNYIILKTVREAEMAAERIACEYSGPVGFDTESTIFDGRRSCVDLIQIYVPWNEGPVCYLFQVGMWKFKKFPKNTRKLITSKTLLKFVSAPENDSRWLSDDFGITLAGCIDIQSLALLKGEKKIGLDALAEKYIPGWKPKPPKRLSLSIDWTRNLSPLAIEYATNDAWGSFELGKHFCPELCVQPEISEYELKCLSEGILEELPVFNRDVTTSYIVRIVAKLCSSHEIGSNRRDAEVKHMSRSLVQMWRQQKVFLKVK